MPHTTPKSMQVYAPCENNTIYTICEKAGKYVICASSKQQASAQTAVSIDVYLFHLMVDATLKFRCKHSPIIATLPTLMAKSRRAAKKMTLFQDVETSAGNVQNQNLELPRVTKQFSDQKPRLRPTIRFRKTTPIPPTMMRPFGPHNVA